MATRDELLRSEGYWIETIQNKLYNDLLDYIQEKGLSNKEIAKKLGVTKGRISQILNGDHLNFRLDSLIKISLAIDKIPNLLLEDIGVFIDKDTSEEEGIVFKNNPESGSISWGISDSFMDSPVGKNIEVPITHSLGDKKKRIFKDIGYNTFKSGSLSA